MIVQNGNEFIVYASNGMTIGRFKSKKAAEDRLNKFNDFIKHGVKHGAEFRPN
jgi:hypothetical protein